MRHRLLMLSFLLAIPLAGSARKIPTEPIVRLMRRATLYISALLKVGGTHASEYGKPTLEETLAKARISANPKRLAAEATLVEAAYLAGRGDGLEAGLQGEAGLQRFHLTLQSLDGIEYLPYLHGAMLGSNQHYLTLRDIPQARAYLRDAQLGPHLRHLAQTLLEAPDLDALDAVTRRRAWASMTLFDAISLDDIFNRVLCKHFAAQREAVTRGLLIKEMEQHQLPSMQTL